MTNRWLLQSQIVFAVLSLAWSCAIAPMGVRGQDRNGPPDKGQGPSEDDAKQLRKKRLDEMRRLAEDTVVSRLKGAGERPAKPLPEPVFRYSGEFHGIVDATVWVYGAKGRPLAVEKIELYRSAYHTGYLYCLASLCDDLIEVRWPGYPDWSSTQPGVEMRPLPEGPRPASSETARVRQMKEIVRRFTATRAERGEALNIREENRLLAQSIHRYRDPDSGLVDGAIFAFIANGTNPDFLLLIELRGAAPAQATWHYGPARMTTGELHLRLDGQEVWSVPWQFAPGRRNVYPTYVHFPVRQQEGGR